MRSDPRCPSCDGKVSATAEWCMHCGRDFHAPVDANSEHDGDRDDSGLFGSNSRADRQTDRLGQGGGTIQRERPSPERESSIEWDRSDSADTDRPAVPSGRGTEGPTFLPSIEFDNRREAGRFLGGLGLAGVAGTLGFGLSLPVTGAGVALLAWLGSVVWLARRRSGFDAMRYGSYSAMVLLIFVSFALALAAEGATVVPFLLTLVPVGVATLLVAGFGYTIAETP